MRLISKAHRKSSSILKIMSSAISDVEEALQSMKQAFYSHYVVVKELEPQALTFLI